MAAGGTSAKELVAARGQKESNAMIMMIRALSTCQQKRENTEKRDALPRTPVKLCIACNSAWVRRDVRYESACTANVQVKKKMTRAEGTERAFDSASRAVRFRGVATIEGQDIL